MSVKIGLDVGSTTIKTAVIDEQNKIISTLYRRHYSDILRTIHEVVSELIDTYDEFTIMVTGSGGINASEWLNLPFIQEVVAGAAAIKAIIPQTDVAIELGGEDAKITYLRGGLEQRMNGTCAGGTGAFLDQMATLLNVQVTELDALAARGTQIYPIASRCGVFAKSDIQPLLNDGAKRSDLALSIFQSVVNQTVSGLACGKPIRGKIAFLGGPLHFMPTLVKCFQNTLKLSESDVIIPPQAEVFNAIGAAISSVKDNTCTIKSNELKEKLNNLSKVATHEVERLPMLFIDAEQLHEFRTRHQSTKVKRAEIETAVGATYLGLDAGSTTTKAILINSNDEILFEHYGSNGGNPLESAKSILAKIYSVLPSNAFIARSCVTGYGEHLIKAALKFDQGIIETMAHYTAAEKILPGVEFILDIGGQDMKCLKIKNKTIDTILLNEACSSGCGSFLETFSSSLSLSPTAFSDTGLLSKNPVDLGSRCTVFMNSRVKQAQKEGASVGDISAGLAYSVVKNALFKVIKLRSTDEMGKRVMVQGGTFWNESVLRAFELTAGKNVTRPDIAGLMGAYGACLVAHKEYKCGTSTLLNATDLSLMLPKKSTSHCGGCANNCLLTITEFGDGEQFITNNRCEKGEQTSTNCDSDKTPKSLAPNLYDYKYKRLFKHYVPLSQKDAKRGIVGIPRVLNMYENYPFWFTFFTTLGYRVVLSPRSSRKIFETGIESMPSESVCYPAKLAHGHIVSLLNQGIKFIFYPCIPYELNLLPDSDNHYNCPVVANYPEVLYNNMEELKNPEINFCHPYVPYNEPKQLKSRLAAELNLPYDEIAHAVDLATKEDKLFRHEIQAKAEEIIAQCNRTHTKAIVLAGRPYHLDPEINHGIPQMINSYGFAILTEDSIAHLSIDRKTRVINQWMYHARLYAASDVVRRNDQLELIQLNSFGCGLDAVTCDQVKEFLDVSNKIYTCLKIDEVNNLGAARIRIRSLFAAINEREKNNIKTKPPKTTPDFAYFQKSFKKTHTICAPNMSPIHFTFIQESIRLSGYKFDNLPDFNPKTMETALKHVNNDACYPTMVTLGSMLSAALDGSYDPDKLALMITQTGGGCRATNYIPLLRKALIETGHENVPVVSFNLVGLDPHPGWYIDKRMLIRLVMSLIYGDLFERVVYRVRPYEKDIGETNALHRIWEEKCRKSLKSLNLFKFWRNCKNIIKDFSAIKRLDIKKPRIGCVGEILVKYCPGSNNYIVDTIEREGGEAIVPDMLDFFLYGFYNHTIRENLLDGQASARRKGNLMIWAINFLRKPMIKELKKTDFGYPHPIDELAKRASNVVSPGMMSGEGWFLTGEMLELIDQGINNIVCMQPFGCLPNHVSGKGVIKALKELEPNSNIVAIDYDPGASEVNQLNRLKLMMNTAFENLK